MTAPASIVEQALRVHGHLEPHEYQGILRHWTSLDHRLQSFAGQAVDLQLFVNERDTPSQHVTLEVRIPGHRMLVASSAGTEMGPALHDIRELDGAPAHRPQDARGTAALARAAERGEVGQDRLT